MNTVMLSYVYKLRFVGPILVYIIVALSSTFSDLNVQLNLSALSSVYIIVFGVRKVFNNFTTEEKSLNREKNLCFATDFSPDFVNRKVLTRVLTTGYLHIASKIGPTNRSV
jgi:hypothetical protein